MIQRCYLLLVLPSVNTSPNMNSEQVMTRVDSSVQKVYGEYGDISQKSIFTVIITHSRHPNLCTAPLSLRMKMDIRFFLQIV